jgi:GntR family transcriptional regulator, transcriptional repressor for pyruvate dehydrogenase complex
VAVTDEAILSIKAMLLSGELKPGDRLPPEKELGEKLGLSRSSLREAVKALELIRVLDVRRGDGTYVTSLEPPLLLEVMSFVVDLHQDASVLEILEVRRILEPAAAAMAVHKATAEDIRVLEEMLTSVESAVQEQTSVEDLVAHDVTFHGYISELSGNKYLSSYLETLSSRTLRARIWRGLTEKNAVVQTLAEHREIVDAIAVGDAELTRSLLLVHINGVERWLRQTDRALQSGDGPE